MNMHFYIIDFYCEKDQAPPFFKKKKDSYSSFDHSLFNSLTPILNKKKWLREK